MFFPEHNDIVERGLTVNTAFEKREKFLTRNIPLAESKLKAALENFLPAV